MGLTVDLGVPLAGRANDYKRWLLVSLTIHAALLMGLAGTRVRLIAPAPTIRISLLEAAPPPPGGAATAAVGAPLPAILPPTQSQPVPRLAPLPKVPAVVRRRKVAEVPRVENDKPQAAAVEQGGAGGDAGVIGGVPGGVAGGQVGGTVGGGGDRILPADRVAVQPALLSGPKPDYPALARARGIEGLVVVEAIISRDGLVEDDRLQVLESVPVLDEAALRAVRRWRFKPGRDSHGDTVRVELRVPIRFQLR